MVSEQEGTHEPVSKNGRSLKFRAFRAGSWVVTSHVVAQFLRLLGNLVMTRLLAPDAFGIMAIAMTVQGIVSLCADTGLRQAIIQSPNGGKASFLNTAWTLEILRSFFIWAICLFIAIGLYAAGSLGWLPLGSVYSTPVLPAVIAVMSLSAVIQGLQSMNAILAHRNLELYRLTLVELFSQVVGLLVMGLLGWLTHSIWSFVAGGLLSIALTTLLTHTWLHGPASRFQWDRKVLDELLHFGKWIWLSSTVGIIAGNGDRLLLGAWVNATVLGYYSIAVNLAGALDGLASRLFGSVSLPALSEVARSQPERLPGLYFRMRWVSDVAFIGLAGFLFASGQEIINLLYDVRYAPAGWMLQWLSFSLIFTRYGLVQNCYLALGRSHYLSAISATRLISVFILIPVSFYVFGLHAAIVAIAFIMAPSTLLIFWFNQKQGFNNFLLEIVTLGVWPIGWFVGYYFGAVVHAYIAH